MKIYEDITTTKIFFLGFKHSPVSRTEIHLNKLIAFTNMSLNILITRRFLKFIASLLSIQTENL